MRRAMILALIAALAIALVAGTAAATPGKGNSGKGKGKGPAVVTYEFKGTVTGVTESTPASITVDVTGETTPPGSFAVARPSPSMTPPRSRWTTRRVRTSTRSARATR